MTKNKSLQIDTLPEQAQQELLDFYEFLKNKYQNTPALQAGKVRRAKAQSQARFLDEFKAFALELPASYRFDRDSIHER